MNSTDTFNNKEEINKMKIKKNRQILSNKKEENKKIKRRVGKL
jgi:hypothetical protein